MAKKKYDIVLSAGSYTNGQGEEKKRWVNVGVVMQGEDGFFALLDPGVNLAAYKEPGKDRVIASLFEPRQQTGNVENSQSNRHNQGDMSNSQPNTNASAGQGGNFDDFDDVPF